MISLEQNLRMAAAKSLLQKIRHEGNLPWWRTTYAESMIQRAEEYIAVGRHDEWVMVLDRLDHWFAMIEKKFQRESSFSMRFAAVKSIQVWNRSIQESVLQRLEQELHDRAQLIPLTERQAIQKQLKEIAILIDKDELEFSHKKLRAVRESWIRRLVRSYRAWKPFEQKIVSVVPKSLQPSGPYNARKNLEDLVSLVTERDPIWMEDFWELYNELFQYAERLTPQTTTRKN